MAVDLGMGSSPTGFCVLQLNNGLVQVLFASEFERPDFEDMLETAAKLIHHYNPDKIYSDAANPEYISSVKKLVNDEVPFRNHIDRCKKLGIDYEVKCVSCLYLLVHNINKCLNLVS